VDLARHDFQAHVRLGPSPYEEELQRLVPPRL
jgi:hypothetical protein